MFLDTPGVVPDNRHAKMNRTLVTTSWRSLDEADHGNILNELGIGRNAKSILTKNIYT